MHLLPRWSRFGALLLAVVLAAASRAAEPASKLPNHCEILRRMPAPLLDFSGVAADAPSVAGPKAAGVNNATPQLGTTMQLALAAARGDEARADECWSELDATFARQKKGGDFGDPAADTAFWLGGVSRSLLVVQQSPLAGHYKERIETLKPAIAKVARWLTGQRGRLMWEDRTAADRLFAEAGAFLFCGKLLADPSLLKVGGQFVDKGMELYRPADGVFLKKNGADSGYQAASLVRLQEIVLHFPDRQIEEAIAKGVQWEVAQVGGDGAMRAAAKNPGFLGSKMIMGPEKHVNVGEISLALLYYHERTGDPAALAAVERLHKYYAPNP